MATARAIATDPSEPGYELWYGAYLGTVRGAGGPIVEAFGYRNLEFEGWEADDVIATLATLFTMAGFITTGELLASNRAVAETAPVEPGGDLYEAVIDALKEIYDPEIPVNIYDLGLIYDVVISPENHAKVIMTLTTPHCPVAESMPGEIELRVGAVPGVGHAEVELVWDPPWDPQKMSDEAKLELGML